ncbi:MAG TPA: RodZ domain-containing protein [Vicinamibacterales bacterium]
MGDFGGTLRSAREGKGISLRHIANSTKISMSALEALEKNDFKRLPGGIFSRSFVRAYAEEVGLDPDQAVADFVAEAGEAFEPPQPVAEDEAPPLADTADPALDFRQSWRPSRVFGLGPWMLIVVFIGVPLAVWGAYRAMNSAAPQAAPPPAVADVQPPADQQAQPGAPGAPAAPPPAATGPVPDLEPGQTMRLVLTPTAECWVSLTVDGEVKFARILNAGDRETHEIREGAVVRIGDAGAMTFTINGRPSKPIGPPGSPETIRITRDNFKEFIQ